MGPTCLLHRSPALAFMATPAPSASDWAPPRRSKIWELSGQFHCSIIGTCLSAPELRQFFVRFGDSDARAASDHDLHGRGVYAASRRDEGGKLLNKALDKRHETAIRRFAKAATVDALRALWKQSLDQGDISGPYWAFLTQPATDARLAQDVFGDVHMLSHQVGAAARLDIARLRRLEADLAEREEKLARQQTRLAAAAEERVTLTRTIRLLETRLASPETCAPIPSPDFSEIDAPRHRLADEIAHSEALTRRLEASEARRARAEAEARAASTRLQDAEEDLAALESAIRPADDEAPLDSEALRGAKILYVGGRPKLVNQLDAYVSARGGVLLAHDGGVEDSLARLPGLVSQADAVYFPVDCTSHSAAEKVKKLCLRLAKSWAPLRSASLASFARALESRDDLRRESMAAAAESRAAGVSFESTVVYAI